jgi:hypothetical protein
MTYEEAKYQLSLHRGVLDEARREWVLEDGFVVSLRPYSGLHEKNLHLVMEALLTVGERLHREPQVDRDLLSTIWSICFYARIWGLHPDGMLQRNDLITKDDITRLELWVDSIEQAALGLLSGQPPYVVVYHYASYVVKVGWWENIGFFIPLMQRALSGQGVGSASTMILAALGKLGGLAQSVLPTLYEALGQEHSWNNPEFETPANRARTTAAVRAEIQKAIDAIERDARKG